MFKSPFSFITNSSSSITVSSCRKELNSSARFSATDLYTSAFRAGSSQSANGVDPDFTCTLSNLLVLHDWISKLHPREQSRFCFPLTLLYSCSNANVFFVGTCDQSKHSFIRNIKLAVIEGMHCCCIYSMPLDVINDTSIADYVKIHAVIWK